MIYKNLIVKVEPSECVDLQRYLFYLKYYWMNSSYQIKHRQIKVFKETVYFIIDNSSNFRYYDDKDIVHIQNNAVDYSKYNRTTYKQLMRKKKLKKICINQ